MTTFTLEPQENDRLQSLCGAFDENIKLIAGVLPEVSEQVILFMLKKDWKYTGLDSYVGAAYCIDKKAEEAFASIRRTSS